MKIPRRPIGRSVVSELQSVRAGAISPAEAARAQSAKFGAIAASATAIGDVFAGIQEIKDEEEFTDAITTYESALTAFDQGIDSMPLELNEIGEPVYDPDVVISTEREGRQKIASDIRGAIRSGSVRSAFDKKIAQSKLDREAQYAAKVARKNAVFIGQKAENKVDEFIRAEDYDSARSRNDDALRSGAVGLPKHSEMKLRISQSEEIGYFYGITNSETFDQEEAEEALSIISDNEMDGQRLTLTPQQLSPIRAKLISRYNTEESGQEGAIKTAQFDNYLNLVDMNNKGELTNETLMSAARLGIGNPELGISQSDFERLQSDLAKGGDEKFSTIGQTKEGFEYFSGEAEELQRGPDLIPTFPHFDSEDIAYNWNQRFEQFVRDISDRDNGLSYDSAQKLLGDVRTTRSVLLADKEYIGLTRQSVYDISGFEPDKITSAMSGLDSQFKETISVANEFSRAVTAEQLRLGPGKIDELAGFVRDQTPIYRLKVNNKILTKVGVKTIWPKSGEIDDEFVNTMQDEMSAWLMGRMETNPGTAARDIRAFQNAVTELERLNGIDIRSQMTTEEKAMVW